MILQRLCEYAERILEIPSMYDKKAFKWQINLDNDGNFLGIQPLSDGSAKNRGLRIMAPNVKRTSGIRPILLADSAKYVLGLGSDSTHAKQFKDLVQKCAESTSEPAVKAVADFLDRLDSITVSTDLEIESDDNIIFRVDGMRPTDLQSVKRFWADENADQNAPRLQCIVCGEHKRVDRVSPKAIKGIPGGQPSGTAIVSANCSAFESYGADQAFIAPTCQSCGESYANAVNHMLGSERHHLNIGPMSFIFWTKSDEGFNPASVMKEPAPEQVQQLIESYRRSAKLSLVDPEEFYAVGLSASASRVVIREWLDTTVPAVEHSLGRWFGLHRIVDLMGQDLRFFGVYALAASLYLKPNDQMVAEVPRAMVKCALSGGRLPVNLLVQAVGRNRAAQAVTSNRIALIKAVLLSQLNECKEGYMERLEDKCTDPAYLCGRLLAVIERAQKVAINPNATLVDRFYGAASSAPATVFGNLLRDFQVAHMAKIRKERPYVQMALDNQAQDILQNLEEFPATLDAKGQAMFALGYYHQKAENRALARSRAELKDLEDQEDTDES